MLDMPNFACPNSVELPIRFPHPENRCRLNLENVISRSLISQECAAVVQLGYDTSLPSSQRGFKSRLPHQKLSRSGAEGGVVSEIEAGPPQDCLVAVHGSVKLLVPRGYDMVPATVPVADAALGNGAFSVPVPVPEMAPCPPA